jgi:hypothetical protein
MPRLGASFKVRQGKHAGVRLWRVVKACPNYLSLSNGLLLSGGGGGMLAK